GADQVGWNGPLEDDQDDAPVVGFSGSDGAFWVPGARYGVDRDAAAPEWDGDEPLAEAESDADDGEGRRTLSELLAGAVLALSAAVVGRSEERRVGKGCR